MNVEKGMTVSRAETWAANVVRNTTESDIRDLWRLIWRRKYFVIIGAVLFGAMAYFITSNMTPKYTATATVMLQPRDTNLLEGIDSVLSGLPFSDDAIRGEIVVLNSNALAGRVVDELGLISDPEFNAQLRTEPGLTDRIMSLVPESWRARLNDWMGGGEADPPLDPALQAADLRQSVIGALKDSVDIEQVGITLAIDIKATSTDRVKAARIANEIANQYLINQLEAKFETTRLATEWLGDRVSELRENVEAANAAVETFRERMALDQGQTVEVTNQQLSELNIQLIEARTERAAAEARYQQVSRQVRAGGAQSAADVLSSPLIQGLRAQEAELIRREAELSNDYGDRHPVLVNVRNELRDLRATIGRETNKVVERLRGDMEIARAREAELQQAVQGLQTQALGQSRASVQLRQLESDAEAKKNLYDSFLARFNETSQQRDFQQPDAQIITQAPIPREPSWPFVNLFTAAAVILGAGVGFGMIFLTEVFDSTIGAIQEVQTETGLSVLASIPSVDLRRRETMVDYVLRKPMSQLAENIRALRTTLLLSGTGTPPKVIAVTSSSSSEGKSSLTSMLGTIWARSEQRVIVVDSDSRHPRVHQMFSISNERGVLAVLADRVDLDDAIVRDPKTQVDILPTEQSPRDAVNQFEPAAVQAMFARLREKYDVILVDTPPVLSVADTRIVSKFADTVLYAVRWRRTPRDAVRQGIEQLYRDNINVAGVVVTQVNFRKLSEYGYRGETYRTGDSRYYLD